MFDRYIEQTRPSWKRRVLIIASIALHALAGVVLVIWSFFHVDEIAPPALSLTFFSAAPPPPPPPPPKASSSSAPKTEKPKVEKPKEMVQPTEVKPIVQPKEPEPKPEEKKEEPGEEGGKEGGETGGKAGGEVGGVKDGTLGGKLGGTPGGTGTGPPTSAPAPQTTEAWIKFLKDQISAPVPHLPDWFKNQHARQTVNGSYRICLRPDGRVGSVSVMTSIPGVDDAIMEHIKSTWLFKPQTYSPCFVKPFRFQIQ